MNFYTLFAILTVFDTAAVVLARYFVEKNVKFAKYLSVIFFGASAYIFSLLMQYEVTAIINILWVSLSTIFIAIICYFLFDEKISAKQSVGILLILVGMNML